ncbi:Uncharacterised protein [Enterobacter asburiae]|nr:Uncharacterised protein [Enterobacter asburiae]
MIEGAGITRLFTLGCPALNAGFVVGRVADDQIVTRGLFRRPDEHICAFHFHSGCPGRFGHIVTRLLCGPRIQFDGINDDVFFRTLRQHQRHQPATGTDIKNTLNTCDRRPRSQ